MKKFKIGGDVIKIILDMVKIGSDMVKIGHGTINNVGRILLGLSVIYNT